MTMRPASPRHSHSHSQRLLRSALAGTVLQALATLSVLGAGPASAAPPVADVAPPSRTLAIELPLVGGQVAAAGGIVDKTLKLPKGADVELRWRSDRPIALHFHGYDIERKVAPDTPATMTFRTTIPGRFPVSEHVAGGGHRETAVLYIEVPP